MNQCIYNLFVYGTCVVLCTIFIIRRIFFARKSYDRCYSVYISCSTYWFSSDYVFTSVILVYFLLLNTINTLKLPHRMLVCTINIWYICGVNVKSFCMSIWKKPGDGSNPPYYRRVVGLWLDQSMICYLLPSGDWVDEFHHCYCYAAPDYYCELPDGFGVRV